MTRGADICDSWLLLWFPGLVPYLQNGPQTLQGVRETAIVKPIGEEMKLNMKKSPSMQRVKSTNCKVTLD